MNAPKHSPSLETSNADASLPPAEELKKYLETFPTAARIAFAARCALRIVPLSVGGDGRFAKSWRAQDALSLPRAVELTCLAVHEQLRSADGVGVATHAARAFATAARAAAAAFNEALRPDDAKAAAHVAHVAEGVSDKGAAAAASSFAADAVFAAYAFTADAIAREKHSGGRANVPDLSLFVNSARSDLSWLENHRSASPTELLEFISSPLFVNPRDDALTAFLRPWSDALIRLARQDNDSAEAETVVRRIEGYFRGRWDWTGLARAYGLRIIEPTPIPISELPLFLARLAYRYPSTLALAETPTRDAFERLVTAGQRADLPALAATLARETADFVPDPLWLAWLPASRPGLLTLAPPSPLSASSAPEKAERSSHPTVGKAKVPHKK